MKPVIMLFVSFMLFILGTSYTAEASNGYEAIITCNASVGIGLSGRLI